mmetsp:Transcript_48212/g.53963  ORF Transcript_48212/g.53963 Transcript_48212/m.53963 type:complete len:113 (+) Transcript_48212:109-447(+)
MASSNPITTIMYNTATTTLPVTPSVTVAVDVFSTPPVTPSSPHYLLVPRRRLVFNPPPLKKQQHCYCSSSSFLPIHKTTTNLLPYLDLGSSDEDDHDDDQNQDQDQDQGRAQ